MFAPLVLPYTPRLRTLRILAEGTTGEDEGHDSVTIVCRTTMEMTRWYLAI